MADHLGHLDALVHRAVRDVQIGSANAAVGHVEPYLPSRRVLHAAVPDRERTAAFVVDRAHGGAPTDLLALTFPAQMTY